MRSHLLRLSAVAALCLGAAAPAAAEEAPLPTPLPALKLNTTAFLASGAAGRAAARAAQVSGALHALIGSVPRLSDPGALRLAFQAYYNFRAAHPEQVRNPYLYFVDFGLDSRTPRGYVFDMQSLRVVEGPFTVAHGRGSSSGRDGVPDYFSNTPGSATTSLGLFLTQESYPFVGNSGGSEYHSIGLRISGLSGSFNSAAYDRRVVVHGAPYVTPGGAGRSEGCPAMEPDRAERLIPLIANGGLVFLFSPLDSSWLREDPWAHADTGLLGKLVN